MDYKRSHDRKILRVEINCLVNFGKDTISGLTFNISSGGICLISKKPLSPGSTVDLDFTIPFKERIVAVAEVKWNKELESHLYSNGLRFMSIKEDDLEKLKIYLAENKSDNSKGKTERRKNERVDLGVFVNYMTVEAYAVDISESGIRIIASEKMETNQEIQLMFFLPDLSCVMLTGKTKWFNQNDSNQYEYGIEFKEPHEKDLNAIKKYVKMNI